MTIDITAEPVDASPLAQGLKLRDAVAQLRASGRLETVELTSTAVPVRECGCCGAAIGRMMPRDIDCPRRRHRG
jgi:hypothetical protein